LIDNIKFLIGAKDYNFLDYNFIAIVKSWVNLSDLKTCGIFNKNCNIYFFQSINFENFLPMVNSLSNLTNTMAS
jgi:hypothetical protein